MFSLLSFIFQEEGKAIESDDEWREIEEALDQHDNAPRPQRQSRRDKLSNQSLGSFSEPIEIEEDGIDNAKDMTRHGESPLSRASTEIAETETSFKSADYLPPEKENTGFINSSVFQSLSTSKRSTFSHPIQSAEDSESDSDIEVVPDGLASIHARNDTVITGNHLDQSIKDRNLIDLRGLGSISTNHSDDDPEIFHKPSLAKLSDSFVHVSNNFEDVPRLTSNAGNLGERDGLMHDEFKPKCASEIRNKDRRSSEMEYLSEGESDYLNGVTVQEGLSSSLRNDSKQTNTAGNDTFTAYTAAASVLHSSLLESDIGPNNTNTSSVDDRTVSAIRDSDSFQYPQAKFEEFYAEEQKESGGHTVAQESDFSVSNKTPDKVNKRSNDHCTSKSLHAVIDINDDEIQSVDSPIQNQHLSDARIGMKSNFKINPIHENSDNEQAKEMEVDNTASGHSTEDGRGSDFKFLVECFPDYDTEYLRILLELHYGNALETCAELLKESELNAFPNNVDDDLIENRKTERNATFVERNSVNKVDILRQALPALPEQSDELISFEDDNLTKKNKTDPKEKYFSYRFNSGIVRGKAGPYLSGIDENVATGGFEGMHTPKKNKKMPGPKNPEDYLDWLSKEYDETGAISESSSFPTSESEHSEIEDNIPKLIAKHKPMVAFTADIGNLEHDLILPKLGVKPSSMSTLTKDRDSSGSDFNQTNDGNVTVLYSTERHHDSEATGEPGYHKVDLVPSSPRYKEDVPVLISSVKQMDIADCVPQAGPSRLSEDGRRDAFESHLPDLVIKRHQVPLEDSYESRDHSLTKNRGSPYGELFFCEDPNEKSDSDIVTIALDRRLAMEFKLRFGGDRDIDVGMWLFLYFALCFKVLDMFS